MALEASFPDFCCTDCGSPSIRIEGALRAVTPVRCGGCGKHLGEWSTFVEDLEEKLRRLPRHLVGEQRERRLCCA
jgi:hypothetical protein